MTMVILLAFFALFAMVSAADDGGPWARVEAFFAKNKAEAAQAEGRFHLSPEVAAGLENVLSQCRQEVQKTVGDAKDLPFCAVWFSNFRSIGGFVVVTDGTIVACNDVPPILRSKENVKTAPADAKTAAHLQAAAQATAAMQSRDWNDCLIVHVSAANHLPLKSGECETSDNYRPNPQERKKYRRRRGAACGYSCRRRQRGR